MLVGFNLKNDNLHQGNMQDFELQQPMRDSASRQIGKTFNLTTVYKKPCIVSATDKANVIDPQQDNRRDFRRHHQV